MKIVYAIPENPEYYDPYGDSEALTPLAVDAIEKHVAQYAQANYPGIEFETKRVPETMSYGNKTQIYADSMIDPEQEKKLKEIVEEIDGYVEKHWIDWWEKAISFREFLEEIANAGAEMTLDDGGYRLYREEPDGTDWTIERYSNYAGVEWVKTLSDPSEIQAEIEEINDNWDGWTTPIDW